MMTFIPTQKLEINNIKPGSLYWHSVNPPKPITPLSYVDKNINLQQLCILTPFCKVKNINLGTGRIQLDVSEQPAFVQKILAMQENLIQTINTNYQQYFPNKLFTIEEIRRLFQSLIEKNVLTIYIPYGRNDTIPIYESETGWTSGISNSNNIIKVGDKIRIALKIYGISYQYIRSWTGRSRIQHQVFSIYKSSLS
jgi:hypothetical protein